MQNSAKFEDCCDGMHRFVGKFASHVVMEEYIKPSLQKMHIKMDSFVYESDLHGGKEKKLRHLVKKLYENRSVHPHKGQA